MANNEQIRKLIRQIVKEEVQALLPGLLSEVFTGLIAESLQKPMRQPLNEVSYGSVDELDDYPTMRARPDRNRMATLMGLNDMHPAGNQRNNLIVSSAVTEHGTEIPVDPSTLPDHVVRALTRNYSDVMQAINKKNG